MKGIKFEYVFAIAVLVMLSIALFIFRTDKDIVNIIITALVGALSAVTAFFFTKYTPSNKSFLSTEPTAPKEINSIG